jgi:hypothetical protein
MKMREKIRLVFIDPIGDSTVRNNGIYLDGNNRYIRGYCSTDIHGISQYNPVLIPIFCVGRVCYSKGVGIGTAINAPI